MSDERFFLIRLIPPRPDFPQTMSADEAALMSEHVAYWSEHGARGTAIVFGPVADPHGAWGVGIVRIHDDAEIAALERNDPVIRANRGFRYEVLAMPRAVIGQPRISASA